MSDVASTDWIAGEIFGLASVNKHLLGTFCWPLTNSQLFLQQHGFVQEQFGACGLMTNHMQVPRKKESETLIEKQKLRELL